MLARSARSSRFPGRRYASFSPLDRLILDIHAAHHADQQRAGEASSPVTKSAAALRGESMRGDVKLPRELQVAVDAVVEAIEDKPALRQNALELYAHLRRTSSLLPTPSSYRERQALTTTYDEPTSLAYLAGLMPSVYAATLYVLNSAQHQLKLLGGAETANEAWQPDRLIDFGSGTGSAAWAFEAVWGPTKADGTPREYVGLDASRDMVELSSAIFGAIPLRRTDSVDEATSARLDAKAYQLPLPASDAALAKLQLTPKSSTKKRTIALAAFSLGDLSTKEKRKELVRAMWDSGAEVMIVIDRGTPAGSRLVIEAREHLLSLGRREVSRAVAGAIDPELLELGIDVDVEPEVAAEPVDPSLGSHVIAPCPHDGACPLHRVTKTFCHFSQRIQTPAFLRHTKHTTRGEDDAKFSYVVVRRGQRPSATAPTSSAFAGLMAELDASATSVEAAGTPRAEADKPAPEAGEAEVKGDTKVGDVLTWPRMIAPPLKRSGHVILDVCAASGNIERHTIPKSQGRQEYYDARKSAWGDSFPHAPKNGPQPSPWTTPSGFSESGSNPTDDVTGKPMNKFGGNVKTRTKKAEREFGKTNARAMREAGRAERGERRMEAKYRRMDEEERKSWGEDGDGDGIAQFGVEQGPDGLLRTVGRT
ncbi:hypothetical protein JCM1840_007651 [Sporobolomyces johnsonii]